MKQLITRVDDELHAELKATAAAEGRSVNAIASEALADAVHLGRQANLGDRLRAAGLLVEHAAPVRPPNRSRVIRETRGAGRAVSDAFEADRARR
jgi:plasmid stability protein